MLQQNLALLFERDIIKLKNEILAYKDEDTLWEVYSGISNSGGNLCLHLLGNMQYYIGTILGKSGYIRKRSEEFSLKNIPRDQIMNLIDTTLVIVVKVIQSLDEEIFNTNYPEKVFEYSKTTQYFLLHLLAHLNYHLGQINYHRRKVND